MSIGGTAGYGGMSGKDSNASSHTNNTNAFSSNGQIPTSTGTSTLHAAFKRVT
jgi:hypothetical protein